MFAGHAQLQRHLLRIVSAGSLSHLCVLYEAAYDLICPAAEGQGHSVVHLAQLLGLQKPHDALGQGLLAASKPVGLPVPQCCRGSPPGFRGWCACAQLGCMVSLLPRHHHNIICGAATEAKEDCKPPDLRLLVQSRAATPAPVLHWLATFQQQLAPSSAIPQARRSLLQSLTRLTRGMSPGMPWHAAQAAAAAWLSCSQNVRDCAACTG